MQHPLWTNRAKDGNWAPAFLLPNTFPSAETVRTYKNAAWRATCIRQVMEMLKRYMSAFRPDDAFFLGEFCVAWRFLTRLASPSVTVLLTNMLLACQDFPTASSANFREMCHLQISCIVLSAIKSVCDQRGIDRKFILDGLGWSRLPLIRIDCRWEVNPHLSQKGEEED